LVGLTHRNFYVGVSSNRIDIKELGDFKNLRVLVYNNYVIQLITFILLTILSYFFVYLIRRYAERHQIIDHPNERSSHSMPTPRGGGLAIVILLMVAGCAAQPAPNLPVETNLPLSNSTQVPSSTPPIVVDQTNTIVPTNTSVIISTHANLLQYSPLSLPELNTHYSTGDIALSQDEKFMAVVARGKLEGNKSVWVWNVFDLNQSLAGYHISLDDLWSVAFSPDGSQLAVGGKAKIIIVDWRTGSVTATIELPNSEAIQVAYGQNNTLVWSSFGDKVTVWDLSRAEAKYSVDGITGFNPTSFAISPDEKMLVTGAYDGIHLWDFETGQSLEFREGPEGGIGIAPATVFSSKGTFLASTGCSEYIFEGCSSGKIVLWKSNATIPSIISEVHPSWINTLAFSPDEETLASTSGGGIIKLINLDDGKIIDIPSMELPGKLPPDDTFLITDIGFLADGQILAVSTSDGIQLLEMDNMSWMPNLRSIFSPGYRYTITSAGDDLNFRKEPSINSQIIKKLHTGEWLVVIDGPIIADGYVWWKVTIADFTVGWIVEMPGWYEFNP
jgi:WD40 repeat protein